MRFRKPDPKVGIGCDSPDGIVCSSAFFSYANSADPIAEQVKWQEFRLARWLCFKTAPSGPLKPGGPERGVTIDHG
jgi:hypothetical protein